MLSGKSCAILSRKDNAEDRNSTDILVKQGYAVEIDSNNIDFENILLFKGKKYNGKNSNKSIAKMIVYLHKK